MSKFWDWFDELEDHQPTLRFLIFFCMMLVCYLFIPAVVAFIFGRQYFTPMTYVGVLLLGVLAMSKHFRWPR